MIDLDHVILATPDLDGTGSRLESEHRLPSVPGGRHAGLGTENRIVPLGEAYVELVGVADRDEASANAFGSWVLQQIEGGEAWIGWCVRTDDLDAVRARLGLDAQAMSRSRPDGLELRWRLAGLERAREEPWRQFFIQWDFPEEEQPGRAGGEEHATDAPIAAKTRPSGRLM